MAAQMRLAVLRLAVARGLLQQACPGAGWVDDELEGGEWPPGEWWLVDPVDRRIGQSVTAMLQAALVVRMTVPATFQLGLVASGHIDGFWQHSDVRSGLAAGALLVAEAGGIVTDTRGKPWTFASADFLASAPGVHREAVDVLRPIA